MILFTVTGIRNAIGADMPKEEKQKLTDDFLKTIKPGEKLSLALEKSNPVTPKAIAVYRNRKKIGYIANDQCPIVHSFIEDEYTTGTIESTNNHSAIFITIKGAPDKLEIPRKLERILPESPLGDSFRMPLADNEEEIRLLVHQYDNIKVSKENLPEIKQLLQEFIQLSRISICFEDKISRYIVSSKLQEVLDQCGGWGISDEEKAELNKYMESLTETISDLHCVEDKWFQRVFKSQLLSLWMDKKTCMPLYRKYCGTFLEAESFEDAGKTRKDTEYKRLAAWLQGITWFELRDPKKLDTMAYQANYLNLSREELYDLYSVLMIMEKLQPKSTGITDEIQTVECNPEAEKKRNYKVFTFQLNKFLKGEWFSQCRSNNTYDEEWIDAFTDALMKSEYADSLVGKWTVGGLRQKKTTIWGLIVGALKKAGVLKGKNDDISKVINITDYPRTFGKYIGDGTRHDLADWVEEYVKAGE